MIFGLRPCTKQKPATIGSRISAKPSGLIAPRLCEACRFESCRLAKTAAEQSARGGFVRCKGAALESCRCLLELPLPGAVESEVAGRMWRSFRARCHFRLHSTPFLVSLTLKPSSASLSRIRSEVLQSLFCFALARISISRSTAPS